MAAKEFALGPYRSNWRDRGPLGHLSALVHSAMIPSCHSPGSRAGQSCARREFPCRLGLVKARAGPAIVLFALSVAGCGAIWTGSEPAEPQGAFPQLMSVEELRAQAGTYEPAQ